MFEHLLNLCRMNHELIKQKLVLLYLSHCKNLKEYILWAFRHIYWKQLLPRRILYKITLFWKMEIFAIVNSVVDMECSFRRDNLGRGNGNLESKIRKSYFIGYLSLNDPFLVDLGSLFSMIRIDVFIDSTSQKIKSFFCLFAMYISFLL